MTDRKKPGMAFWATVALVVVLVAYPLSLGPATWLFNNGWLPGTAINWLYAPLAWIGEKSEPFGNALEWYVMLWMP
jgi:hypothetical protein